MPKGLRRDALIHSLQDMHAHYARLADSIRTTLLLLQGQHVTKAGPRLGAVLDQALALDEARRAVKNGRQRAGITQRELADTLGVPQLTLAQYESGRAMAAPAKPRGPKQTVAYLRGRRERSAAFLKKFSTTEPRVIQGSRMSPLIVHGYLAKKGDGYVRTAKPYTP